MLRLNIRHQLPQTDLRIRRGTLDRAVTTPAQVHTNQQQARSNKGTTQPSISIDTYASQTVTGRRTMYDLTRERGQRGLSDVQQAISRRTQIGYSRAENGAKKGDDIATQYRNQLFSVKAEPVFSLQWTRGAEISVQVSEVVGETDVGNVTAQIEPQAVSADIRTTQGGVQTYLSDQGFIRRWVTEDYYDIYA